MINKPELLAPAGDLERLKIALKYGADAVYVGGSLLSLRANAINFSIEELKEGIEYAHNLNKKVYVTVNIVMHNEELKYIDEYMKKLSEINVDAIIVSDPCIFKYAKKYGIEIHLSTQQSTMNYEAVKFFEKQGITRVVLARECSKDDIKLIKEKTNVEIETFIHGAMCAGISGRCVLSNFLTNRDANRGGCSQICRWDFDLLDENKNKIILEKPFTFCSKDLMMYDSIKDMIDLGIASFKIEGRMRSLYYIATVVSIYRKIIDYYCDNKYTDFNEDKRVLERCANRDSTIQFFNGIYDESCSYYNGRMEVSNQDFLGIIRDIDDEFIKIEQRNYIKKGDIVEIFGPNHDVITYEFNMIYNEDYEIIDKVNHPRQIFYIEKIDKIEIDDLIRIKRVDKQ